MTKIRQKKWFWIRRSRLYLGSKEMHGNISKFKGSVFAVILGLLIGMLVILGTGNNPITYFHYLLFYDFSSFGYKNWDNTLVWWAIYIVAGLALVISFKTGMFNIGVAGQMLAAGAVVIAIGVRYDLSQPLAIIIALFCGVAAAVLVAAVTALLKVWFNVHEVVTSILLNWTIWYLVKWLMTTSNDLYDASRGATMQVHDQMSFIIAGYKFILPLLLAAFLVVAVWFMLKKTTLGYKVKTVGLNHDAAAYAGISRRRYAFTSFVISGALAGVMGVIYYVGMNPSMSFASDSLPAIGFDSISVALVGQINPFGAVAAAFLWGLIKSGGQVGMLAGIPNAISDIIFGVIIYSAACAVLLARIAPVKFFLSYFNVVGSQKKRHHFHHYLGAMWHNFAKTFTVRQSYRHKITTLKKENKVKQSQNKDQLRRAINSLIVDRQQAVQVCYAQIHQEWKSLKNFVHEEYQKLWTTGTRGVKNRAVQAKKQLYGEKLNQYINARITYEESVHMLHEELQEKVADLKKQNPPSLSNHLKSVRALHDQQVVIKTSDFNQQFYQLIDDEQEQLLTIKKKYEKEKNSNHHHKKSRTKKEGK